MQPGVSCAGGGQGAQLPPPRGAVCVCVFGGVVGQAAVETERRSQGRPGYPSPGEFSDAQGGACLPAFRQDGVAGSNHAYAVPGATVLCLGNAWHLINGSW